MKEQKPPTHMRPGRIIHLSFIASLAIYVLVVEWLARQPSALELEPVPDVSLNLMRAAFGLIAAVSLGAALGLVSRSGILGQGQFVNPAFLLAYSAMEFIAVLGLILFVMGRSRLDFYLFAFASLIGQLLMLTQANRWDRLAGAKQDNEETATSVNDV